MGKHVVHFKCCHCSHCCTEVVCLPTPWDVVRITRETGTNPYEFLDFVTPEVISEVPKSDPTWLECGGQRYLMALRRHGDRCHFLNHKSPGCTIYEFRPILCQLYPFALHETRRGKFKSFTLHKDVGCPRRRDGITETKRLYDLYVLDRDHQEDYADLVHVFNRQKDRNKQPQNFIKLFVEGARPPSQ